jgi:uncharacterized membrane protein YfcA
MAPLGLLLASAIGLSLGLLGGGGSILTVPVLVYVLGYSAKPAIAMSLLIVGTTSVVGAASHWRAGNVHLRQALGFGVAAMAGAFAGARLSALVSDVAQMTLLAIVMLAAAASMLRPARGDTRADRQPVSRGLLLAVGLGVGVITGLVGIGGGFLIVPALVLLARLPMSHAVGTSLVVIAMNAASGFAGYAGRVDVDWPFVAAFTAVAIAGILAGSYLVRFVAQHTLKRAFAVFLLLMGTAMLYQNRAVFSSQRAPQETDHAAQAILR